jgi:hypothetical protein
LSRKASRPHALQLIRLYKWTKEFSAAARLGEEVLTAAEDTGDVPPSVLLAVIQDLPWREASVRTQLLWPKQAFIEQTIISYANAGYDQTYRTLAAVARWWSQEAPDVLTRVLAAIPVLNAKRVDDDEARFTYGDILFEASRASDAGVGDLQALALSSTSNGMRNCCLTWDGPGRRNPSSGGTGNSARAVGYIGLWHERVSSRMTGKQR